MAKADFNTNLNNKTQNNSITRSAAVMGVATFLSRIAGLLREQTFAFLFGAGLWTDAFNVAFRIPNLLRDLFAEGAMSAAFVPTFNSYLQKEGNQKAFKLTNLTFSALLVVVGTLTVAGIIITPSIVKLIAPEFDGKKFEVTVTMTRIMFPFLMAISWSALAMGMLNSLGEFFIPAVAPAFLNFAMIIAGWTLCPLATRFNMPAITGMAIGAMMGGFLQFAVQIPSLWKHGFRFRWKFDLKDPGIKRIVRLIIPGTIGLAATQVNIAVSTILATSQGDGAVSWLSYAFRVMQLPLGLFGVAVAQATLPVISRQAAENKHDDMAKTLCDSIRLTSFINLFACFAIMALAEPIIRILFQHGRFLPSDTIATAMALRAYATGLLFFCLVKVMGPAFYALDNTRIPVFASIVSVVVNIVLNLALIGPLGYWGLALGTGIAAIFNAGILYLKLDARLGGFKKFGLKKALMGILFATGISGAFIYWLQNFATAQIALKWPELVGGLMVTILVTAFSMVAGTLLLFLIAYLLKIEEATKAKALIARRLFAKKNKET